VNTLKLALEIFLKNQNMFIQGAITTLIVSLSGTIFGLFIGFFLSAMRGLRISRKDNGLMSIFKKIVRMLTLAYIEIVRGTPMIAQAVFLYYALYKSLKWTPLVAGIVIVSLNTGAYMSEIIRSGIQSVDPGQREAALTIGMSESMTFRSIILPQAIKNAFPSIGNEFVVNIKDTSVLNVIALTELFFQGMSVAGSNFKFVESMIILGIIYFILTFTVTRILHFIEGRLDMPKSTIQSVTVPKK